ncbi:MAG: patatin-like phospholipase family protein [Thermoanaerobaculales bacterium]|nr:patatin-like phospholipase family protein [Thermoanaerobaculales bacterium]
MKVQTRHILVYSPSRQTFKELCLSVCGQTWVEGEVGDRECSWNGRGLNLEIDMVDHLEKLVEQLHTGYYNLVMVDCRHVSDLDVDHKKQEEAVHYLLDVLGSERDIERRYPLRRVVVLVGDVDDERVDRFLFQMGKRHVGACLRDTSLSLRPVGGKKAARARFIDLIWQHCEKVMLGARRGKKAISAAGGGITGIYYELGVLKCLHDAFDTGIHDFDMFLGISGGAVVTSCLANGISIDDLMGKVGDLDDTWNYRLKLSWKQLNIGEVPRRVFLLQREMVRYVMRMLKREDELSVASVFGLYAVLLGPIFDNNRFEKAMRRLFKQAGGTNSFRRLGPELYIGATDQDRREHVLFGDVGFEDVPISRAVQASSAMHPFFPSVEIKGRYYTDGIVTRTANLRAAIDHGADLVFILDPFVPLISETAGFNGQHGNMWVVEQDYKTMSFTRFTGTRDEILRSDPDVNTYSFVPSNRMRRYMAKQNPFVSRNFHPIVCEAYSSTFRRLKQLEYKMRGELASHNINLDLMPVKEKVERLTEAKRPDVRLLLENEQDGKSNVA